MAWREKPEKMNTFVEIILIFLMLVLNGVFAMSEIAVLSARKLRLQQRAEDGDRGARAALELNENPNRFLSTVQIGITLISIFTGALGGATLAERLAGVLDTLAIPWMTTSTAEGLSLAVVVLPTISTVNEFVELDEVLYVCVLFWLLMAGPGKASVDHLLARR